VRREASVRRIVSYARRWYVEEHSDELNVSDRQYDVASLQLT